MKKKKIRNRSNEITSIDGIYSKYNKEDLIQIHAEAYYRAFKQTDGEKKIIPRKEREKVSKFRIFIYLFFKPKKLAELTEEGQMADTLLVVLVDYVISSLGFILRWGGYVGFIIFLVRKIIQSSLNLTEFIYAVIISFFAVLIGGIFTAASKDLEEIQDRDYIHKFTASIMALLAFFATVIAIIK